MTDQKSKPPVEQRELEQLRATVKAQAQQIAAMRERLESLIRKTELNIPPGDESKN